MPFWEAGGGGKKNRKNVNFQKIYKIEVIYLFFPSFLFRKKNLGRGQIFFEGEVFVLHLVLQSQLFLKLTRPMV